MGKHIELNDISSIFERQDVESFKNYGGLDYFITEFKTDKANGIIDPGTFKSRRDKYGENKLPDPPSRTFLQMMLDALNNLTLKILLTCAIVGVILHFAFPEEYGKGYSVVDFIDSISITTSVLIVTLVSSITDYIQQKNFMEINRLKDEFNVTVVRNGDLSQILNTELLVGDVLAIKSGDKVAADCIYITGHNLKIDNSQQTGESVSIHVDKEFPIILSGSLVEEGDAHVLVCAVGVNSQDGISMSILSTEPEETPLERRLNHTALILTYIGLVVSVVLFLVKLIIWSIKISKLKWSTTYISELVEPIMVAVTIFISIVPEGLPLAITLSLGFSMKSMVKDNNFVRHLNACETMGGATTICSDKTGTLTQNKMEVVQFYCDNRINPKLSENTQDLLNKAIALNTTAYFYKDHFVGQSSENALIKMITTDYKEIRDQNEIQACYEFNSARKSMTTFYQKNGKLIAYTKGAPDILLPRCTKMIKLDGNETEMTTENQEKCLNIINQFADEALRTILIAYAEANEISDSPKNLVFIGIAGIKDPLRPEVFSSIDMCRKAGVMVRMVTGDYINTARAIARECGILTDDGIILTGAEFSNMSKSELIEILPKLQVLARSSPRDKLRLVELLMEAGEVVAVTGDGSNDAPALKCANVGLSMGMCGTELAKVASDIVILDDNFSSIVEALKWGRCVYDNVRAFLQYLLTMNIPSVVLVFVGYLAKNDPPFTAVQLLWSNVIVGSVGSLALATNKPTNGLLDRKPYGEADPIVSNLMWRNMIGIGLYQIICLFLIFFGAFGKKDYPVTLTMMFTTFVYSQIFNLFNARVSGPNIKATDGLFSNSIFIVIFFVDIILQAIVVVFGGVVFSTVSMKWQEWLICLAFSIGNLIIGALLRLIYVKDRTQQLLEANRELKLDAMRIKYREEELLLPNESQPICL